MSEAGDVQRFNEDLWELINYFRKEHSLNYAEAIGVLEIVKNELLHELPKEGETDDVF